MQYREFEIRNEKRSGPVGQDWMAVHDSYDGADDSGDNRYYHGADEDDVKRQIDAYHHDLNFLACEKCDCWGWHLKYAGGDIFVHRCNQCKALPDMVTACRAAAPYLANVVKLFEAALAMENAWNQASQQEGLDHELIQEAAELAIEATKAIREYKTPDPMA